MTIFPDFKQPVQTLTRLADPPMRARTRWMLGFQRRLVRRWECDTDMPHEGFFPHTSHTEAMVVILSVEGPAVPPNNAHTLSTSAPVPVCPQNGHLQ